MTSMLLFGIASGLLVLGFLGHTLGGMVATAKRGPGAGPEADEVFESMKSVRFMWQGFTSS